MKKTNRLLTLITTVTAASLSVNAVTQLNIEKPDFAYPQDVIKTAEAFLADKTSYSTPELRAMQLLAVSEIAYATESIDKLSYNKNIASALDLSDKFGADDPDLSAMLKAYAAELATAASNLVTWNRAQLEVRPADMDQWTRRDFQLFADSLYGVAYDIAAPDAALDRFGKSLKIDRLGYQLTPTVRDFIYLKWYDIKSAYRPDRAIASHLSEADSPLYFYLEMQRVKYSDLMDFCRRNVAKKGSEFALYRYFEQYPYTFEHPAKDVYEFLLEMKQAYPNSWVTPLIDTQIKNQLRSVVRIKSNDGNITPRGLVFTVTGQNIDTVKVTAYGWRDYDRMLTAREKGIYTDADYVRQLSFAINAGIEEKTVTDTVNLPDGNYLFVGKDIKFENERRPADFTVMPWRVVSYSTKDGEAVAVFDAITGKPAAGVEVIIKYYQGKKQRSIAKVTDRNGLARFDGSTDGSIWLRDKSKGLLFNADCSLQKLNDGANNTDKLRFSVSIDRSVYRPGETVRWTAVAMNANSTFEGVNVKARVTYPVPNGGYKFTPDTTFEAGTTDRYGRVHGEFVIPADVATGSASIGVNDAGRIWFNISEYKLRDLQIKDIKAVVTADSVRVTGRTVNYTGVGISGIDLSLTMDIDLTEDSDTTIEFNTTSVEDGLFTFNFKRYNDSSEFVNVSLHASAPDGRSADASTSYPSDCDATVFASVSGPVDISKGMNVKVTGTDYSKTDKRDELRVGWQLTQYSENEGKTEVFAEGQGMTGDINIAPEVLRNVEAGGYRLKVYALDCKSDTTNTYVTVYNSEKRGLPNAKAIAWIPNSNVKVAGDSHALSFLVGVRDDNTMVYWMTGHKKDDIKLHSTMLNAGYHTINIDLSSIGDGTTLPLWAVKNGQIYSNTINFEVEPETAKTLNLTCETFRDRVNADSREHWSLVTRIGDKPVSAAVAVNIYNTQLDEFGLIQMPYIYSFRNRVRAYLLSPGDANELNLFLSGRSFRIDTQFKLPAWLYIPFQYGTSLRRASTVKIRGLGSTTSANYELDADGGVLNEEIIVMDSESSAETSGIYGARAPQPGSMEAMLDVVEAPGAGNFGQLRTTTVLNALWSPMLTTGDDGRVDIDFVVPNQTTRWRMTAVAWTTDLASAKFVKTFDAIKPILVAPNLPRFVRVGDKVNLVSAITNATDSVQTVNYRMEVTTSAQDSPVYSFADGQATIKPRSTYYVTTTCVIDDALALADSIAVTMRADNGTYGDGERRTLPVLTSSALVTESVNFYLNTTDSVYTLVNKIETKDATSRLSFTANPMWTVVESLPKALEPSYDVAPSLVMSLYSARSAVKIADEHPEAAAVIDVKAARKVRDEAMRKLSELQTADGGFRWGKWSDRADLYTTLNVLEWLDEDVNNPEVAKLTAKALEYVDAKVHTPNTKIAPNLYYTYVRSAYGKPSTLEARQIFDATTNTINRTWKKMSIEDKSTAAITMYRTGNRPVAREIMRSVVQFGTMTPDRGLIFHNMRSIVGYATLLRAMSTVEAIPTDVDAVRQALLYLRQGMNWGTSAHTTYAVRAMMTGSTWVVNRTADDVRVLVDSKPIVIDSVAAHTGAIDVVINGKSIEIERTPGTPAYGALVTQYVAPLSNIEAFSDGEISIEKNIYAVKADGNRVALDRAEVHAGDRLVVSLTVKAARPMTGIILNDMRSAAFEPVQQLSRYSWHGELGYYIENRDSATNIYLYYVPRGTWTIEYDVTVNTTGTFTTGMATATSTVDANLTAHSSSSPLTITQ